MGRLYKQGIDYYPMDVGFLSDIKVRKIMKACGVSSVTILISLLGNIYRDGYYIRWDNDMPFLVADQVGASEGAVCECVLNACRVGFFNLALYDKYKILTSKGIQERYWSATSERGKVDIVSDYCLLEPEKTSRGNINLIINRSKNEVNRSSRSKNGINRSKNEVNLPESTQRKEKDSRVKKSKDKTISSEPSASADAPSCLSTKTKPEQGAIDAVITLTLNDKTEHPIFKEQVEKWADLYPAVNVIQQLRGMKGWLDANPTKRKTKTGILRFINAWLIKTQDRGGDGYAPLQRNSNWDTHITGVNHDEIYGREEV